MHASYLAQPRRPSPLRARRLLRGMRLRDLSLATGLADALLSALERGEHPLRGRALRVLASYYVTTADGLRAEMERWAMTRGGEGRGCGRDATTS
jgi:transcriptional regulator with XRE-family HTH domain